MKKHLVILIIPFCFLYSCNTTGKFNRYNISNQKSGNWIETLSLPDTVIFVFNKYKNGAITGKTQIYYSNGKMSEGFYVNDKKQGCWVYYDENNEIFRKEYFTEGYVSRIEFIENGKIVKSAITTPPF